MLSKKRKCHKNISTTFWKLLTKVNFHIILYFTLIGTFDLILSKNEWKLSKEVKDTVSKYLLSGENWTAVSMYLFHLILGD
jgi:hypothetical protein